jgi:hypothetical protein
MKHLKRLVEAKKKKGRCWSGYKPAPGSTPYSKGSCVREAYKRLGFVIAEYALTKPDQDVSDARKEVEQARKQGAMAAKAIQTNPKNPRYQKDLIAANKKLNQNKPKASEPMTHEK